ncbi:hypothetical protein HYS97_03375 [Candidatus Daviesbacteria bacterium]|nr:hypothetical protein [Candidatus Daviesbacteria bacterium]
MNEIPSGIYVDEAVVAYDAYSILETGKDHFGKYFPLHFRFFGAYTPPLFVYLSSLTIYFLGYDIFSLRIISFVSILISALILHLFLKNLHSIKNQNAIYLAVFFFLILPSSVFFGRIGY